MLSSYHVRVYMMSFEKKESKILAAQFPQLAHQRHRVYLFWCPHLHLHLEYTQSNFRNAAEASHNYGPIFIRIKYSA